MEGGLQKPTRYAVDWKNPDYLNEELFEKELRRVAEPLITLAKEDTLMRRRLAYSKIQSKKLVKKLFEELGPRFKNRPGGYLRILKAGNNLGDNSPQAYIELTD